jgi:hypothetical protein
MLKEYVLLLILIILVQYCSAGLVNKQVNRIIDASSGQLVKYKVEIKMQNEGKETVSFFNLAFRNDTGKLSVIKATEKTIPLEIKASSDSSSYTVYFSSPLEPSAQTEVIVSMTYIHSLEPKPKEIAQGDKQYVLFKENLY